MSRLYRQNSWQRGWQMIFPCSHYLPQASFFLPHPGEPMVPWDQWKMPLEMYLLAMGPDTVPVKLKMAYSFTVLVPNDSMFFAHSETQTITPLR